MSPPPVLRSKPLALKLAPKTLSDDTLDDILGGADTADADRDEPEVTPKRVANRITPFAPETDPQVLAALREIVQNNRIVSEPEQLIANQLERVNQGHQQALRQLLFVEDAQGNRTPRQLVRKSKAAKKAAEKVTTEGDKARKQFEKVIKQLNFDGILKKFFDHIKGLVGNITLPSFNFFYPIGLTWFPFDIKLSDLFEGFKRFFDIDLSLHVDLNLQWLWKHEWLTLGALIRWLNAQYAGMKDQITKMLERLKLYEFSFDLDFLWLKLLEFKLGFDISLLLRLPLKLFTLPVDWLDFRIEWPELDLDVSLLTNLLKKAKDGVNDAMEWCTRTFQTALEQALAVLDALGDLKLPLINLRMQLGCSFKDLFKRIGFYFRAFSDICKSLLDNIKETFNELFMKLIPSFALKLPDFLDAALEQLVEFFADFVTEIAPILGIAKNFIKGAKDLYGSAKVFWKKLKVSRAQAHFEPGVATDAVKALNAILSQAAMDKLLDAGFNFASGVLKLLLDSHTLVVGSLVIGTMNASRKIATTLGRLFCELKAVQSCNALLRVLAAKDADTTHSSLHGSSQRLFTDFPLLGCYYLTANSPTVLVALTAEGIREDARTHALAKALTNDIIPTRKQAAKYLKKLNYELVPAPPLLEKVEDKKKFFEKVKETLLTAPSKLVNADDKGKDAKKGHTPTAFYDGIRPLGTTPDWSTLKKNIKSAYSDARPYADLKQPLESLSKVLNPYEDKTDELLALQRAVERLIGYKINNYMLKYPTKSVTELAALITAIPGYLFDSHKLGWLTEAWLKGYAQQTDATLVTQRLGVPKDMLENMLPHLNEAHRKKWEKVLQ